MESIRVCVGNVFNPKQPVEMDFKAAVKSVDTQLQARITKVALFTLASIALSATLVLSEAAVIVWPVTLPIIALTLVLGGLFFRLNSIDRRYVEWLDDDKRTSLVKNELERIFHSKQPMSNEELSKSLKAVNRVLGNIVFDNEKIHQLCSINSFAINSAEPKSLAEIAKEQMVPIHFSCTSEWIEPGRFGLQSYEYEFKVNWNDATGQIDVAYCSVQQMSIYEIEASVSQSSAALKQLRAEFAAVKAIEHEFDEIDKLQAALQEHLIELKVEYKRPILKQLQAEIARLGPTQENILKILQQKVPSALPAPFVSEPEPETVVPVS